ncbi:MAG: DUF2125 domain-containing protein [Mesorhizobium sp.]
MTSSEQSKPADRPRGSRRFIWLLVAILAAIGLYTGGWYWAADRLQTETTKALADLRSRGQEADCTNASVRGYPFRLGLFCDALAFADPAMGLSVTGTGLRSATQIYEPRRLVGELDQLNAHLVSPSGFAGSSTIQDLRFSTRLAQPMPELTSFETGTITIADVEEKDFAAAQAGQAHIRPNGADLDIATSLTDVAFAGIAELPGLAIETDSTLLDGVAQWRRLARSVRGAKVEIRNAAINAPDSGLSINGAVSVDENGLVDAALSLTIRNPPAAATHLATAFPELAPRIRQMQGVLSAMGGTPTIPISIAKGQISISFFKVGRVPPLN